MSSEPDLSDLVLRAFLLRHSRLTNLGSGPVLVGSRFDADTRRLLEAFARNRLSLRWMELEGSTETEALLRELDVPVDELPIVVLPGGSLLHNPTTLELLDALGLADAPVGDRAEVCDLLVVGGGPAGLAAAVYGASEGLTTTLAEDTALGGQAGTSTRIENYLGFPAGLSGEELAARAGPAGAEVRRPGEARHERGRPLARTRPARGSLRRRRERHREGDHHRHRCALQPTAARSAGRVRGRRRLLRRDAGRVEGLRRRVRGRRRGRELGRAGGALPLAHLRLGPHRDPRRVARELDVALPDRPDRARSQRGGHGAHRSHRPRRGAAPRRRRTSGRRHAGDVGGPRERPVRLHRRHPLQRMARRPTGGGRGRLLADRRRPGNAPIRAATSPSSSRRAHPGSSASATCAVAR